MILVTGGTGFIGQYVVRRLIEEDYPLLLLTRGNSSRLPGKCLWVDISKGITTLKDVFKAYEVSGIIHLATFYAKTHALCEITPMIYTNIALPTELIQLASQYHVPWFINTGTFFEYDQQLSHITEESRIVPRNLYARTKVMFDTVARDTVRDCAMSYLALRIFSPYGFGDKPHKIIPTLISSHLSGTPVTVMYPEDTLDFIHVTDIAEAYVCAVRLLERTRNKICDIINVATGCSYSMSQVIATIEQVTRRKVPVQFQMRTDPSTTLSVDTTQSNQLLSWKASLPLRDGLAVTIEDYTHAAC